MKTIALAAAKGGVGKTTLAAALAVAATLDAPALRVELFDLDPEGSLTAWRSLRRDEAPLLLSWDDRPLPARLDALALDGFDLAVLDCPPGFSAVLEEAVAASDLVLVPTQASALDLMAVGRTAEMAERAGVPHRFVLNRAVFHSRLAGQAVTTLREGGRLLWPPVHQRVPVPEAMTDGRTVLETSPACPAARELRALWAAVSRTLAGLGGGPR